MDTKSNTTSQTFGQRLVELRVLRGLTVDELCYESRLPRSAIRRWEKERNAPTLSDDLLRLATALKTSPSWLFFGDKTHDYPLLETGEAPRGNATGAGV